MLITMRYNVLICEHAHDPGLMLSLPEHLHRTNILSYSMNEMM